MVSTVCVGARVSVKATYFDDKNNHEWSKYNFGEDWETAVCLGEVCKVKSDGWCTVLWDIDSRKTSVHLKHLRIMETLTKSNEKVNAGRRELPHRHAEWQQLWYSNFEEFQRLTEPNFDNNTITNITVQLGATAFLHCRVRNLGERTISWVRRRDWHILTSGMFTYTNDERFQVLHSEGSDDWTLQIKYVQKRDNGTYECQISTGTGIMSHFVDLHIVVPEAFILGSGEHHVDVGSEISLVCIIEKSPTPPQYVFWYHNDRMINYDTSRGGITVETEPGPKTQSRLTIRDAHDTDSGNYTCSASNTEPASIYVFVSEGDKMAAIQRRKTSSGSGIDVMLWFVILPLVAMAAR